MSRLLAIVAALMLVAGAVAGLFAIGSGKPTGAEMNDVSFSSARAASEDASLPPVYDIPKLEEIKIDGEPGDWGERGLQVNALANTSGKVQPRSDIDATLRLGWNDRGLLALITVHDDIMMEEASPTGGDSVELFIAPGFGRADLIRCAIGPGVDPAHPRLRTHVFDERTDARLRKTPARVSTARTKTEGGYIIEALIPWSNFGLKPIIGREIAFQLIVNDVDAASQATRLAWYPSADTARDATKMQRLRLASGAAGAPPPVNVAAYGDYPRYHRTRITVLGDAALVGKVVEIVRRPLPGEVTTAPAPATAESSDDDEATAPTSAPSPRPRVLVSGKMESDFVRPEMASANLSLPIPPRETGYGLLDVVIDGRRVGFVDLPKPGYGARWIVPYEQFTFSPCVFSTRAFPEGDFENASFVEDLIGPYETRVTFYDADFNPVVTADKPGRYGAVVEVRTDDGHVFKRYKTLFRETKDFSWRNTDIPVTVKLPKEMGITAAALRLQQKAVSEYYKQLLEDEGMNRDGETAVLLAGLYETKATAAFRPLLRNTPQAMDRAWWAGLKCKLGEPVLPHLVFLPHGYLGKNEDGGWKIEDGAKASIPSSILHPPSSPYSPPSQRWPLVLFLHGKGERGDSVEQVKEAGLPARLDYDRTFREQFPAILVAPQCPADGWWSTYELAALLDDVQARYPIDPDRIYLTGMSMGGYGAWALATEFPDRFAAVAPVCGGGDPDEAERLLNVPVWTFHGNRDTVVPIAESRRMVEALHRLGNEARFTIFPEDGHDAWTDAYANPELYAWLFSHRRSTNPTHGPDVARAPLLATPATMPAAAAAATTPANH